MRRGHLLATAGMTVVLAVGCASEQQQLPPSTVDEVSPLFAEDLAAMGLQLTDRGGLVDATTYEPAEDGTHLSLYVAPIGDRSDEEYVDGLVSVTGLFAQDVFDRWPALASFDVCQEGVPPAGAESAPARTQVTLTRSTAAMVSWSSATVQDVAAVVEQDPTSRLLVLDDALREVITR